MECQNSETIGLCRYLFKKIIATDYYDVEDVCINAGEQVDSLQAMLSGEKPMATKLLKTLEQMHDLISAWNFIEKNGGARGVNQ